MTLVHVSGPATLPVSVAEMRQHLRVDTEEEDAVIESYIRAALLHVEKVTGVAFAEQTWRWYGDEFPDDEICLGMGPVIAVTSVTYQDADDVEQTLDPAEYRVDVVSQAGRVILAGNAWPTTNEVENSIIVEFTAGLATTPEDVKHAIRLLVASMYEDRAGGGELRDAALRMVAPHRRVAV